MNWNNLLSPENAFFSTVRKLLYLAELSIIWTVCCVPVVTIGPATAALYYSVVKAIRKERSYPVKEFMSAFRENLKNGAAITAVLLVVGISSGIADYLILLPSVNSDTGVDHLLMFLLGSYTVQLYDENMAYLEEKAAEGKVEIMTMSEFGAWYMTNVKVGTPEVNSYQSGKTSEWTEQSGKKGE